MRPANEDCHNGEYKHVVKSGTDASEYHFTQLHEDKGNGSSKWGQGIHHAVDRATGSACRDSSEKACSDNAEPDFLAFHVSACLCNARYLVDSKVRQDGIAHLFKINGGYGEYYEDQVHRHHDGNSLSPCHLPFVRM